MSDLYLMVAIPITIVVLVAVYQVWLAWLERPDCDHHYGDWSDFHETHYAYVQKRTCQKCKYTQTLEQRKMSYEHTKTTK